MHVKSCYLESLRFLCFWCRDMILWNSTGWQVGEWGHSCCGYFVSSILHHHHPHWLLKSIHLDEHTSFFQKYTLHIQVGANKFCCHIFGSSPQPWFCKFCQQCRLSHYLTVSSKTSRARLQMWRRVKSRPARSHSFTKGCTGRRTAALYCAGWRQSFTGVEEWADWWQQEWCCRIWKMWRQMLANERLEGVWEKG